MKKIVAALVVSALAASLSGCAPVTSHSIASVSVIYRAANGETNSDYTVVSEARSQQTVEAMKAAIVADGGTPVSSTVLVDPEPIESDGELDPINSAKWGKIRNATQLGDANRATTGKGVVIAVVDSGVSGNHPDIAPNLYYKGYSSFYDDALADFSGHGTAVAQVAAAAKNGSGVQGIAYNARIMPVKVDRHDGKMYQDGVAEGVFWAANNGADIINISNSQTHDNENMREAIDYADSKGVIVVVSAGNDREEEENPNAIRYPASYPNVITNGNWDVYKNELYPSSNTRATDFINPGVVYVNAIDGSASTKKQVGTSFATPYTAGTIALLKELKPDLTRVEAFEILKRYAHQMPVTPGAKFKDGTYNTATGWGMPDVEASVASLLKAQKPKKTVKTKSAVLGSSVRHTVYAASNTLVHLERWDSKSSRWVRMSTTKTKKNKATVKLRLRSGVGKSRFRIVAAMNQTHKGGELLRFGYNVRTPVANKVATKSKAVRKNKKLSVTVSTKTATSVQLQVKSGKKWKNTGKPVKTRKNKAKVKLPTAKVGSKKYRIVANSAPWYLKTTVTSFEVTVKKASAKKSSADR